MKGKRGIIMGVANKNSLAWAIAKKLSQEGAEIALTYESDFLKKRIMPLAESINCQNTFECNVSCDKSLQDTFLNIQKTWETIDFIVHSIAFSDKEELKGQYVETSRKNFINTLDISCFSFTAIAKHASRIMKDGGSLLTLTYFGAERVMPHYNVMGVAKAALECSVKYLAADLGEKNIRVNALSAGPVRTLASAGINNFHYILKWNEYNAPLKRNVSLDEVGKAGYYLLSDLSSGVTGETHHVDCGYNTIGMKRIDAPDLTLKVNS